MQRHLAARCALFLLLGFTSLWLVCSLDAGLGAQPYYLTLNAVEASLTPQGNSIQSDDLSSLRVTYHDQALTGFHAASASVIGPSGAFGALLLYVDEGYFA
jgi:hypothetical protein